MEVLTVSKAKAGFSNVTRSVIKNRRPVVVRTPVGLAQFAPYDPPKEAPPAEPGPLKLRAREHELHNTFGDSL